MDGSCRLDELIVLCDGVKVNLCDVGRNLRASGDCCFGIDARMDLVVAGSVLLIFWWVELLYSCSLRNQTNRGDRCIRE